MKKWLIGGIVAGVILAVIAVAAFYLVAYVILSSFIFGPPPLSPDEKKHIFEKFYQYTKEQGVTFQEFAKKNYIPVQNLYNWQRNHADKIAERLKAGDTKAKIIAALVQEILKTKNNSIQEEEDQLITEIARLKYNNGEYPNEALLNAVRDGMLAKCSDFSTSASAARSTEYEAGNRHPSYGFISVLIQEHAILMYQEDYEHDFGKDEEK